MWALRARFMIANTSEDGIETIEASAHCDGPCGVYDPASARVAGEAVQSMTKKMLALAESHSADAGSATYINTMSFPMLGSKI